MKPLRLAFIIFSSLLLFAACSEPVEDTQSQVEQTYPDEPRTTEQTRTTPMESDYREIQGEVISVSPDDQTLTVRTDTGEEIQVTYNTETKVTGSQEGTQGLATVQGSRVRVRYEEGVMENTAVEIDVEPMTTG
ncbi:MAG TPA: hypothetical protein VKZ59_12190 [Acidobacteriota bacterium]|nr:hypothetical protein [Acidobacteriota bacterium]